MANDLHMFHIELPDGKIIQEKMTHTAAYKYFQEGAKVFMSFGGFGCRIYNTDGVAGLIITRRNRYTGFDVSIYHNEQAGMDCGCGISLSQTGKHNEHHDSFSTVCEEHGQICSHRTLMLARAHLALPAWCEVCQEILIKKGII